jgi:hypothetical protein
MPVVTTNGLGLRTSGRLSRGDAVFATGESLRISFRDFGSGLFESRFGGDA